jgi:hypothetical protein
MAHSYNVETGAWIQDPQEGWVSSKVISKNIDRKTATLVFEVTSGDRFGEVGYVSVVLSRVMMGNWIKGWRADEIYRE